MADASPTKWHLAHTSWFFESFVLSRDPGFRPLHASYAFLFNSYYETLGARHPRPAREILTRPALTEVMTYRTHVTKHVLELVDRQGDELGELGTLVELGLQHEQQHQELIVTDLKHLFVDLKKDPSILEAAYDDAQGVTAAFNLNILSVLNRESRAQFALEDFTHQAIWNERAASRCTC